MKGFFTGPLIFAMAGLIGSFIERQEDSHLLTFSLFGAAAFSLVANVGSWLKSEPM